MSAKKAKEPRVCNTSGKRKCAIARATTKAGKGRIRINSVPVVLFEPRLGREKIMEPMKLAGDLVNEIDIEVKVKGGGTMGQVDAIRTAIARGLVDYFEDPELRDLYMRFDRSLLVNDPRRKEPKHPQGQGARKKKQKSYR